MIKTLMLGISLSLGLISSPVWSSSYFGDGQCGVIVASRQTLSEARAWIFEHQFQNSARVFEGQNGWLAIAITSIPSDNAENEIRKSKDNGDIPFDSFCSSGRMYVREVAWKNAPTTKPLSTGLFEEFDARPLNLQDRRFIQAALALEGSYSGMIDGVWGNGSQKALEVYSRKAFEREPLNSDAAFIAVRLLISIEEEGWYQTTIPGHALSVLIPTDLISKKPNDDNTYHWASDDGSLQLQASDLTTEYMASAHQKIIEAGPRYVTPYIVRSDGRWVTTIDESDSSVYLRSDLIEGMWATVLIIASPSNAYRLKLMSSSITFGAAPSILPSENGQLLRHMKEVVEVLENEPVADAALPVPEASPVKPEPPQSSQGGTGTGFLVNKDGVFLTNAHVVEGCTRLTLNGKPASLLASSTAFDLAAVSTSPTAGVEPLKFSSNSAGLNADITIAGFPLHGILGGLNVSRGSVSSLKGIGGDETNLQISAPVQPGNSGGPAVDRYGNVVGIVVSKLDVIAIADKIGGDIAQNVNFAVRGDLAKVFLSSNNIVFEESQGGPIMEAEDIAKRLQSTTTLIQCFR